jgi:RNA polymerase sigma factor (sigma-70 family)
MLANASLLAADHSLTDDTIISRVLLGKTDEYEILIRRYNNLLYKTAKGILSAESDVEDVMQDAYIRGYEKLHQFRKEARFSTWLTRILINCALQQVSKLKGREILSLDVLERSEINSLQEIPDEFSSDPSVGENLKKALEAAISQLPEKYRVVFTLREVAHVPVLEVAEMVGISEDNVKIRLHRAKMMLKEMLRTEASSLEIFEFHATRCTFIASRVMEAIVQMHLHH